MSANFNDQTILLVEDSPDDVFIFERVIKKAMIPNPLKIVHDGEQAREYLAGEGGFADRSSFPLPCLIMLDLKLPRMPGLDVLKWIGEQPELKNISVVVLTSSAEDRDVVRAYQLGARSYLVKPPTVNSMTAVIRAVQNSASAGTNRLNIAGEMTPQKL
jgi:DNA-binding response OmpR family regulator